MINGSDKANDVQVRIQNVRRSQFLIAAQCKPIDRLPEFHDIGCLYGPFDTRQEAIDWLDAYPNIRDNYSWTIVPGYVTGK